MFFAMIRILNNELEFTQILKKYVGTFAKIIITKSIYQIDYKIKV